MNTALYCIGTRRTRRDETHETHESPTVTRWGDSASDGDAQSEGRGVQRGVPASRGWYSCVRPRSPRSAHT